MGIGRSLGSHVIDRWIRRFTIHLGEEKGRKRALADVVYDSWITRRLQSSVSPIPDS
jgi:hypothetical protein